MARKYRIFQAISGQATSLSGSKIWLRNLYDPLISLGHEVTLFDIDQFIIGKRAKPYSKKAKEILSNELIPVFHQLNNKINFDLFFGYLDSGIIYPDVLADLSKSIFTINYTTNFHQFSIFKEIASNVNLSIYASKIAEDSFRNIGAQSYYMPFAANPEFYRPSTNKDLSKINFIGSSYGTRPYLMWRLLQNGINLHIFGPGWQIESHAYSYSRYLYNTIQFMFSSENNWLRSSENSLRQQLIRKINIDFPGKAHGTLSDMEYSKVLSESPIVLNINESRYNHDFLNCDVLLGCNLRDFEIPMSGSMSLTQYSDELANFFEDGTEVVSFKNEYELRDKIKFYTRNINLCRQISLAGYQRAITNHTWVNRFQNFFDHISDLFFN